jgi:DNA-nicking Smr family endonuclease|tara:strand:+ start:100 stop:537 length:438 start_codon:yes stop_codon:yes gene_type:complete
VKKKYFASSKDKKDWADFTKQMGNISVKESDFLEKNQQKIKVRKLDLHGYSLNDANKVIKKFIIESFNKRYNKLLIVTGRGLRSKSYDNPYISKNLSILKNSVPEYIKNDENLNSIINKITKADQKDGGEGAINIFLKNNKKFIK